MFVVVGLGCGDPELLTEQARRALLASDAVFVARNYAHVVAFHPNVIPIWNLNDALDDIEAALARGSVAVGVSGDPGVFSFLGLIRKRFADMPNEQFRVVPGVGALSYFFAKLRSPWHDVKIVSGHGRPLTKNELLRTVARNAKTAVFCDKVRSPEWVCDVLGEFRRDFYEGEPFPFRVAVGENMSLANERVSFVVPGTSAAGEFDPHSIAAVFNADPEPLSLLRPRDADFIRGDIPMTHQEVRSAVLDELRPDSDSIVWDIGAGTGSVTTALSRLCPDGEVHAVERLPEAVNLIELNKKKFRAWNIEIHCGNAPEALESLPCPTHVFIGGSGGALEDILNYIAALGVGKSIRVCVASVALETLKTASSVLTDTSRFKGLEVVNVAVTRSRPLGEALPTLMAARNPVTLWTATTGESGTSLTPTPLPEGEGNRTAFIPPLPLGEGQGVREV